MNDYETYFRTVQKESNSKKYENLLAFQIQGEKLKTPTREFRFHPERRWRFDFAFPDDKLAVEVEGGIWANGRHNRGSGFEGDCAKYNEAMLAGWRVIRVTSNMVKDLRALNYIKRALHG